MIYRHEVKHLITPADKAAILARMRAVATPDPHAGKDGRYLIRSLYFDDPADKALHEKLDGLCNREKFRIRYYDGNTDIIRLEKKVKRGSVGCKVSAPMTREEVERLLRGDIDWMLHSGRGVVTELYSKMRGGGLRPKVLVDYIRTPFIYAPGNVRVTVDEQVRMGRWQDFLDPDCLTLPTPQNAIILEVKWDDFLPSPIRSAVQLKRSQTGAFSKYAACRSYG